jgi:chromosome segregation ATPase
MSGTGPRKRLSARISQAIDWRIDRRVPPERLDGIDRLYEDNAAVVRHHEDCIVDHRRRLDDIERRFGELERLQRWTANELERIVPQVSAQESQMEGLRAKLAAMPAADEPQVAAARSLIEEIQREHAQVRIRLTGVAMYEDRLRALEDRTNAD